MRAALIFIGLLLIQQSFAQIAFTGAKFFPSSTNVAATSPASTGTLLTLTADATNKYAIAVSDALTLTVGTESDFYITLVCTNAPVDFGLVDATAVTAPTAPLVATGTTTKAVDVTSCEYPSAITGTTTTNPGILTVGTPVKAAVISTTTANKCSAVTYTVASSGTSLAAFNSANTCGSGDEKSLTATTTSLAFSFEVIDCGKAIFCIQTAAQYTSSPGNCDGGASTALTCSAATVATCLTNIVATPPTCNTAICATCLYGSASQCLTCQSGKTLTTSTLSCSYSGVLAGVTAGIAALLALLL